MLITVGSVTTATRLQRLIERELGAPARVTRTPRSLNRGGCSYSVRTRERYLPEIRQIIGKYRVPVKKFYSETSDGAKRMYNAVP